MKILDFGLAHLAMDPRLAPKGAVFGTPEYMAPEQARGEEATAQSDLYALGVLFFEMLTGQLPFRSDDRETLLEMQRTAVGPAPRSIKPDVLPAAESIVIKLLEKDRRKRFQDAHHLHEELKSLQRSLPSTPWDVTSSGENAAPPPPPPPQSPGVIEWASRAALFSRMVSRAYPAANAPPDVQSATRASLGPRRARDAPRGRGGQPHPQARGARAPRPGPARRDWSQGRGARARGVARPARSSSRAGRGRPPRRACRQPSAPPPRPSRPPTPPRAPVPSLRAVFERAVPPWPWSRHGASSSRSTKQGRGKDAQARDLRRQIEELRAQLARYAEALEEDLTSGREKVAARTREGLAYEKAFSEVSSLLLNHLKTRPEARDLLQELIATMHGQSGQSGPKSESRTPGT